MSVNRLLKLGEERMVCETFERIRKLGEKEGYKEGFKIGLAEGIA